ncbi:hypothetical protein M9H77_02807 [Catharanthus roseus]|uniref:Uncharacterized protein n=1 Tax=Catharanthus roseus TaxID=4058 RepID=A0ACC0C9K9_CATRO|nr:hypothetical protein M9H77_02807 [Catharanthus roseus]
MEGMEIIPNLFEDISWGPLLTVNELYYPEMIYEFYANLHQGRVQKQGNITYEWVTSRVGGRDISFDDRMLNSILVTHENCIRFYTNKKICFDPNPYGMLGTKTSSTKCLPYGCFLTKVFQYFVLNFVGVGDHIGVGKIYNKHTFKRMRFSRNEESMLVRGNKIIMIKVMKIMKEMRDKKL